MTRGKTHQYASYFRTARGMAAYRAGDWAAALDWNGRGRKGHPNDPGVSSLDLLFEAMAHHRLGHTEDASRALSEAVRRIDKHRAEHPDGSDLSHGWLISEIVRKEAEGADQEVTADG